MHRLLQLALVVGCGATPAPAPQPREKAGVEQVRLALIAACPNYEYPHFLRLGLPEVWQQRAWREK